jgi:BON domain-containing protein
MQFTAPRFGLRRSAPAHPLAIAAPSAACGMTVGALLAYFFDPKAGRRRRHTARDRSLARVRRGERRAAARARRTRTHAVGVARRTVNAARPRHREPFDDVTLAHKVESELYRRARVPRGRISINAEEGFVFLRGVLDRQDDIERIELATRQIDGVRDVENLIHLPGTPAPHSHTKSERLRSSNASR